MAEGRMLKKEISDSIKLGRLKSDRPRVLWFMMLPHLDRDGRLKADPYQIKGQVCTMLPYSVASIQKALEQLHEVGLLVLYQVDGDQYVEYTRFNDFQAFNYDRESKSKIPAPTQDNSGVVRRTPLKLREVKLSKDKYSDSFIDFWKAFKGRWNVDKGRHDKGGKMEAFEEWQKLNNQQQAKAMKAAPLTGSKITKDACRWLKYHRWEDFESDVTPEQHTTKDQQALEKKKHTIRSEYSDYYRSQTTEHLQEMSKANALITHRWLIKEILAKKG